MVLEKKQNNIFWTGKLVLQDIRTSQVKEPGIFLKS